MLQSDQANAVKINQHLKITTMPWQLNVPFYYMHLRDSSTQASLSFAAYAKTAIPLSERVTELPFFERTIRARHPWCLAAPWLVSLCIILATNNDYY